MSVQDTTLHLICHNRRHPHALRGTLLKHDKGVFLKTGGSLIINFFAYSDFSGLWSCEDPWYPTSLSIKTYFVICIGEFPVEWKGDM